MAEQPKIKEALAYYNYKDWAECACTLIRNFGISGAASQVKALRDIIEKLQGVSSILENATSMIDNLDDIMARLIPGNMVNRLMFQQLEKINICPLFSDLLLNIGGSGVDILRGAAFDNFLTDKHEWLSKKMEIGKNEINDWMEYLLRLEGLISTIEGCVSSGYSTAKSYENEVLGTSVKSPKKFDQIPADYFQMMNGNVAMVGDELWIVYTGSPKIYVQRKVLGVWQAPVFFTEGSYPTIFFDGTYVRIYFRYNEKITEAEFLPGELGYLTQTVQLWDCFRNTGSYSGKVKYSQYECSGSNESKLYANLKSFPDGGRAVFPVPAVYTNATYDWIQWDPGVSVTDFTVQYKVYRDGIEIYSTSGLIYDELLEPTLTYYVVAFFTFSYDGVTYEGCHSDIIDVPDDLGRATEEDYLPNASWNCCSADLGYNKLNVINYSIEHMPAVDDLLFVGIGGSYTDLPLSDINAILYGVIDYDVMFTNEGQDYVPANIYGVSGSVPNFVHYFAGEIE